MWNNTPEIGLWEMYDQVNSCMEDVIVYLKDEFPGESLTSYYTGIQPGTDHRRCGHNAAFSELSVQMMLSHGTPLTEMENLPAPPMDWYNFVRDLLCVREDQHSVLEREDAERLCLVPHFQTAMAARRVSFVPIKRQLAAYVQANLEVICGRCFVWISYFLVVLRASLTCFGEALNKALTSLDKR